MENINATSNLNSSCCTCVTQITVNAASQTFEHNYILKTFDLKPCAQMHETETDKHRPLNWHF